MLTKRYRITASVLPDRLKVVYLVQLRENTRRILATRRTLTGAIEYAEMLESQLDIPFDMDLQKEEVSL
jgi:hypothetical protein